MEESINSSEDLNGPNFANSLTSVNNIYKKETYLWSINTILIIGGYVIDGIKNKRFSRHFQSVKSDVLMEIQ